MSSPADTGHATYIIYLLLGTAVLFPWNAFITAADYFEFEFPGRHTDRLITVCYLPVTLVMLLVMIHYNHHTNLKVRVLLGMAGFVCAMIAVPLLDATAVNQPPLQAILLFVLFVGICDGIAQGAIFGDVALLPPKYTQAVVTGTAVSGVAVSLLRVITKAALPGTPTGLQASANIYFTVSALVCAVSFLLYAFVLPKLPFVVYHRTRSREQTDHHAVFIESDADIELNHNRTEPSDKLDSGHISESHQLQDGQELLLAGRTSSSLAADTRSLTASSGANQPFNYVVTAKLIWQPALSVLLVYLITLAIFPGFLAEDVSSERLGSWYPVLLITAFNIADAIGKVLPVQPQVAMQNRQRILILCVSRILFLPAFYLASQGTGPEVVSLLTVLLGLTNGYFTAVSMMLAPQGLEAKAAQMSGNIMVFFLVSGLSLGAAAGFLWLL